MKNRKYPNSSFSIGLERQKSRWLVVACCLLFVGCGGSDDLQRMPVSGAITLDGKRLPAGTISFTPTRSTHGPAATAVIADGHYELDSNTGPVIGDLQVSILAAFDPGFAWDDEEAYRRLGGTNAVPPNPIPPRYNEQSELSVTVSRDGPNEFDFALKSR